VSATAWLVSDGLFIGSSVVNGTLRLVAELVERLAESDSRQAMIT
jgi:hypothetical protein